MQQEYYREQAVANSVMPEDVAHTLAFDRMAGCTRGHEWQVVHVDMDGRLCT